MLPGRLTSKLVLHELADASCHVARFFRKSMALGSEAKEDQDFDRLRVSTG